MRPDIVTGPPSERPRSHVLIIDDHAALVETLVACGAAVKLSLLHYSGALPTC